MVTVQFVELNEGKNENLHLFGTFQNNFCVSVMYINTTSEL